MVTHLLKSVTFERLKKIFGHHAGTHLEAATVLLILGCTVLQCSPFDLTTTTIPSGFHPLCLHELSFFDLQELSFVLSQFSSLLLLNDLNSCCLTALADQHLQDWLDLEIK